MATIAEQLTSLANTKTAIKNAIIDKGVQVADTDTFASYATKIGEIQSGGGGEVVNKTKFGVSIDDVILTSDTTAVDREFEFDATSIERLSTMTKTVGGETLYMLDVFAYKFYNNLALVGTVDLSGYKGHVNMTPTFDHAFSGSCVEKFICPSHTASFEGQLNLLNCCENCPVLKTVVITSTRLGDTNVQLRSSFKDCKKLTMVEGIENVEEVAQSGLDGTFEGCVALTTANTSNIKTVASNSMQDCFKGSGIVNADLSGLTSINNSSLSSCYSGCLSLKTANLSNVAYVGSSGLSSCFSGASVEVLDVSALQEVASSGMANVCRGATSLTTVVGLGLLEKIDNSGFEYAFYGCTSLTGDFVFTSLTTLGNYAFRYGFQGCTSPLRFFFPALTTLGTNPFGTSSSNGAFRNATGVTEIHFRADMQATIESLSQYSSKWGATNAAIYFDL